MAHFGPHKKKVNAWLICGPLARGDLPSGSVARAWEIIFQWLVISPLGYAARPGRRSEYISNNIAIVTQGQTKHTKASLLRHALRVATPLGFFFSPSQLRFSESYVYANTVFSSHKVQPWSSARTPPQFHSQPVAILHPDSRTSQSSNF